MKIHRLSPSNASLFQALRLAALLESPSAFGSSYEEEKDLPISTLESNLATMSDRGIFGAFNNDELIGIVALGRENIKKLAHKAFIWGLYVTPQARTQGVGRALLLEAISLAKSVPDIQQINLSVNAGNSAAIRLYESLNFEIFGHEPNALLVDGELHDEMHMNLCLSRG